MDLAPQKLARKYMANLIEVWPGRRYLKLAMLNRGRVYNPEIKEELSLSHPAKWTKFE